MAASDAGVVTGADGVVFAVLGPCERTWEPVGCLIGIGRRAEHECLLRRAWPHVCRCARCGTSS